MFFPLANPKTKRKKRTQRVTELKKEIERPGAFLDSEVRSWIKNVLVPVMVSEYIAEHASPNSVADPIAAVPQCEANGRLSAEGIQ